jgi:hypothetical protein
MKLRGKIAEMLERSRTVERTALQNGRENSVAER